MKPIFKTFYRLYRLFSWVGYRVPRRFTPAGLLVLGALGVSVFMVPDTDNNVAYQGFSLLLFLLALSVCFGFVFRGKFSAVRLLPKFGTVGAPITYTVQIRNCGGRFQAGLTLLEDLADPRPSFDEWLAVELADERQLRSLRLSRRRHTPRFKRAALGDSLVPPLAPGQEVQVPAELTPLRRGVLQFAGLRLARPDPLGLFRAFRKISLPQSLLVLPRRYPLPPIALPGSLKYQQGGVAMASSVGQSEDFVALRDYRDGDPLRHIHWRSWAKVGKPVVKEFEDEFFVRHALVLDTFAEHPHADAFEEAVSVAASFACTIQTQESLLDLLFVGPQSYCFTAGRGLAHADQMLEILASVRACHEHPFASLEHLVFNHVKEVSGCICVLLAWDRPRRDFVEKLRMLGVPLLVLIVVERGGKPVSLDPGPMRDQPERFRVLECGKVEEQLAELS